MMNSYLLGLLNNADLNSEFVTIKSPEVYWALRIKNKVELMGLPVKLKKIKGEWRVMVYSRDLRDSVTQFNNELDTTLWSASDKRDYLKALMTSSGVINGHELIVKGCVRQLISIHEMLNELRVKSYLTQTDLRLNSRDALDFIGLDTNDKINKVIAR